MKLKNALLSSLAFAIGLLLSSTLGFRQLFEVIEKERPAEINSFSAMQGVASELHKLRTESAKRNDRDSERVWLSLLIRAGDVCSAYDLLDQTKKYRPELLDLDHRFYGKHLATSSCVNK